ncbi:MAG: CPBP family intramembrane metalloprotease [Rivularia sp. (in: Bacteria)]|nr:CPBP family intramembrane metalloprotease [Rivularia sp. MS3]
MFFSFISTDLFEYFGGNSVSEWENAPALIVAIAFFVTWILCWLPIAFILTKLLHWTPKEPLEPQQKITLVTSLYLLAPLMLFLTNLLTDESFANYGWVGNFSTLYSLFLGFVGGVVSLAFIFGCQLYFGLCKLQLSNLKSVSSTISSILLVALLVGGIEELVFRGFLFTQLQQVYSVWIAAIISSLIFALLHLVWEQKETIPQLPGLFLMGIVLVLARFADNGSLGMAWGLHAGWVWCIASIDTLGLIDYTDSSEWITGKNQKPLAGVAGIFCMGITAVALYLVISQVSLV